MNNRYVDPLRELQIELGTSCNALCLGCVRTDQRNFSQSKVHIPKGKFIDRQMLTDRLIECTTLNKLEFCGNIDEPLLHPQFIQILERLAKHRPHYTVSIHTNGSARHPDYFKELARVLRYFDNHNIRFSIDGLENTNSIYRQKTVFSKIMDNAQAFIQSGGTADWQFIHFPWNGDDIDEAKNRASKLGFRKFILRKDRSMDDETLSKVEAAKGQKLSGSSQKHRGFDPTPYMLQAGSEIDCFFRKYSMMFISWDGKLWPCCFTANIYHDSNLDKISAFEDGFYGDHSKDFNNLYENSLDTITAHPVYQKRLVQSWTQAPKASWRCAEKCSQHLPQKEPLAQTHFK